RPVGQTTDEQLADAAVPKLVVGDLGVFWKNKGLEPVAVEPSANPSPKPRRLPSGLRNREVVANVEVVAFVACHAFSPFAVMGYVIQRPHSYLGSGGTSSAFRDDSARNFEICKLALSRKGVQRNDR